MRNANQRGIGDRRMFIQDILDFRRIDILAAANDHIFGAIHDEAEAFVIDAGKIACAHPAINKCLCGGVWTVPIAFDDLRAACPQFTDFANRQFNLAIL